MSKKNWIMIKRGLSEDPIHREKMGIRIWLFMHIIDRVDWNTGRVFDWRDKDEAADMGMSWRTLQGQRQELESLGYITCIQKQDSQEIIIHQWVNPRDYSGGILNALGGTENNVPQENEGTLQGTHKGIRKPRTPTSNSGDHGSTNMNKKNVHDPNLEHPAVIAYRDHAHLTPNQDQRSEIVKRVGERLDSWTAVISEWMLSGYRPQNVAGMLDALDNGGLRKKYNVKPSDERGELVFS